MATVIPVRQSGFTLVELLIAMGLGLGLLASTSVAVLSLLEASRVAADRAELAERGRFAMELLANEVLNSVSVPSSAFPTAAVSPCDDPSFGVGQGVRVVAPGNFGCLPGTDLLVDAPLLLVETVALCASACLSARWPGWILLDPGCHAVFALTEPTLQESNDGALPPECGVGTTLGYWSRKVYFLRNYAWRRGDGIGALMVKTFQPETMTFGQAEMLVPGIVGWTLDPIAGFESGAVRLSLDVSGWAVDGVVDHLEANSGLPQQITLSFTAASRNLQFSDG